MPPKRASMTKTAAMAEAAKEQQKRMVERMKALAKGRKAVPVKREDAMDISDSDDEEPSPRVSTARAGARPRSATSTTSTSSSVSRRSSSSSSSSGGGSGSKSSTKASTTSKRKSTSPGERLTKKQAIEEAAKALKARSSNYSPSATTNTSTSKPLRTISTSRPSATTRGRGIPSKWQVPPRVETSDEEEDSEQEEEVVVPPPRQPTRRSLAPVSVSAPRRAAAVPPAPVPSTRTNGSRSHRSYDKEEEEEVEKTQSMGVLGRLGHGVFKLLTYAIIIVSMAFALHVGVETYQHYTPLCFSDSYSNIIMTGRPAGAGACKTTWSCPLFLLCHGGRIFGVAGLDEALAKVFGNRGSSSPVPPPVVTDEERGVEMEEPVQSEEAVDKEAWGEDGEDEWSEDGEDDWQAEEEEEGDWAEEWKARQGMADADEHAAEHEVHEHANENEHEVEYGTEHAHEEEHTPQQ